jgi:AmmeMemoRadiSam system protein A
MLPLTESAQQLLLRLAREALVEGVRTGRLPEISTPAGAPDEKRGAFVTLHKEGHLRGCVGYIESPKPLFQTVRECALAAALRDMRFDPVEPEDVSRLHLEISVLSPLTDITPEQIEIGRHGLLISRGPMRGLLLPQVAVECNWDRERFLSETCRKAGLPEDEWLRGARVQAFTAQVFAESSVPAGTPYPAVRS